MVWPSISMINKKTYKICLRKVLRIKTPRVSKNEAKTFWPKAPVNLWIATLRPLHKARRSWHGHDMVMTYHDSAHPLRHVSQVHDNFLGFPGYFARYPGKLLWWSPWDLDHGSLTWHRYVRGCMNIFKWSNDPFIIFISFWILHLRLRNESCLPGAAQ